MTWKPIRSNAEARQFLELVGGFHDGCLRELRLATETWVGSSLSMSCPGHLDTSVRALLQRQDRNPSAVELSFESVEDVQVHPTPENADSIIAKAEITVADGRIEFVAWFLGLPLVSTPNSTAFARSGGESAIRLVARTLKWRDASDWMGDELRYVGLR